MVATQFLDYLSKLQVSTYVGVEDFADKFNFLFTVIVLLLSAMVVTVKQYMMKPISCYAATDVGGKNLMDYVENYCWVQGTIPNNFNVPLPETPEEWAAFEEKKILYYQWVPFVLGLQCILFYLPRVIWQLFCYNRTGTDIQHIVYTANQAVHSDTESRNKMVLHLAKTLEQMLFQHREYRKGPKERLRYSIYRLCSFCIISKRLGTWLMISYLLIKALYLINAVGQVFLMQRFLGFSSSKTNYTLFGVEILHNIIKGRDWSTTLVFPRVTFCYVPVKQMGVMYNAVSAQCVLPVNMLNEKIYIFLWFWIILAALLTAFSIPVWFMRLAREKSRKSFIKKFLKVNEKINKKEKTMVNKFTRQFLRHDGVFLLRMISLNAGDCITAEIVCQLWQIFKEKYRNRNLLGEADDPFAGGWIAGPREDSQLQLKLDSKGGIAGIQRQPSAPPVLNSNRDSDDDDIEAMKARPTKVVFE